MELCKPDQCTGCGACLQICPTSSISFHSNDEGFQVPVIDSAQCVNCGKCVKVCPSLHPVRLNPTELIQTYVCWNKNVDTVIKSASGGAFSAIAESVLTAGGVVFGCTMDTETNVFHTRIDCIEELSQLHGSKYVQSDTKKTYQEAKIDLDNGKMVLYSGCPCQIAGLYSYLGERDIPNLITVDLVCHGAASPGFFAQYVKEQSAMYGDHISNIEFRNKEKLSWGYVSKIIFENIPPKYISAFDDDYMSCFLRCGIYRKCCYDCVYAKTERVGDFTLGDFAGVSPDAVPKGKYKMGVSLITLNSEHSKTYFAQFSEQLEYIERPMIEATTTNGNLVQPSKEPPYRTTLLHYRDTSIHGLKNTYCKSKFKSKMGALLRKTAFYRKKVLKGIEISCAKQSTTKIIQK